MDVSMQIKKTALRTALGYIEKNPEENVLKLMDWWISWQEMDRTASPHSAKRFEMF